VGATSVPEIVKAAVQNVVAATGSGVVSADTKKEIAKEVIKVATSWTTTRPDWNDMNLAGKSGTNGIYPCVGKVGEEWIPGAFVNGACYTSSFGKEIKTSTDVKHLAGAKDLVWSATKPTDSVKYDGKPICRMNTGSGISLGRVEGDGKCYAAANGKELGSSSFDYLGEPRSIIESAVKSAASVPEKVATSWTSTRPDWNDMNLAGKSGTNGIYPCVGQVGNEWIPGAFVNGPSGACWTSSNGKQVAASNMKHLAGAKDLVWSATKPSDSVKYEGKPICRMNTGSGISLGRVEGDGKCYAAANGKELGSSSFDYLGESRSIVESAVPVAESAGSGATWSTTRPDWNVMNLAAKSGTNGIYPCVGKVGNEWIPGAFANGSCYVSSNGKEVATSDMKHLVDAKDLVWSVTKPTDPVKYNGKPLCRMNTSLGRVEGDGRCYAAANGQEKSSSIFDYLGADRNQTHDWTTQEPANPFLCIGNVDGATKPGLYKSGKCHIAHGTKAHQVDGGAYLVPKYDTKGNGPFMIPSTYTPLPDGFGHVKYGDYGHCISVSDNDVIYGHSKNGRCYGVKLSDKLSSVADTDKYNEIVIQTTADSDWNKFDQAKLGNWKWTDNRPDWNDMTLAGSSGTNGIYPCVGKVGNEWIPGAFANGSCYVSSNGKEISINNTSDIKHLANAKYLVWSSVKPTDKKVHYNGRDICRMKFKGGDIALGRVHNTQQTLKDGTVLDEPLCWAALNGKEVNHYRFDYLGADREIRSQEIV
jgi:hypothetical protein